MRAPIALFTYGQKWSKVETQRFEITQCFERSGRTTWHVWQSGVCDAPSRSPSDARSKASSYRFCCSPPVGTKPGSIVYESR